MVELRFFDGEEQNLRVRIGQVRIVCRDMKFRHDFAMAAGHKTVGITARLGGIALARHAEAEEKAGSNLGTEVVEMEEKCRELKFMSAGKMSGHPGNSHSSGIVFALQFRLVPLAMSWASAVPLLLQSCTSFTVTVPRIPKMTWGSQM